MPLFRFAGFNPLFYPDIRDAEGKSLMAETGTVHEWPEAPADGQWVPVEEVPIPAPQVIQEAPPAALVTPEPIPAPEPPQALTGPANSGPAPYVFPGFAQTYSS